MIAEAHLTVEIAAIVSAFILSSYCFRLVSQYLKGGVFARAFTIFGVSSLLFGVTYVLDVGLDLAGIKIPEFGLLHHFLNILFIAGLFMGVNNLYNNWVKLGGK